jgi:hypothetical protein
MDARIKASTNIGKQLERIADIKSLNKDLGRYISAEKDVAKATERIANEPLRARAFNRVKEGAARGIRKLTPAESQRLLGACRGITEDW